MSSRYSVRAAQTEAAEVQRLVSSGEAQDYTEAERSIDANYVSFSQISNFGVSMQVQYSSRYLEGSHGSPDLGEDIRISGDPNGDYHALRIHTGDVAKFASRVVTYLYQVRLRG